MASFIHMSKDKQNEHIQKLEDEGFDRAAWGCRYWMKFGQMPYVSLPRYPYSGGTK